LFIVTNAVPRAETGGAWVGDVYKPRRSYVEHIKTIIYNFRELFNLFNKETDRLKKDFNIE
jgi:hypothetical protein